MKRGRTGVALAMAGLLVGGIWLGVAVTGHAANPQQVTASLKCEPGTVKPEQGQTVGCTLTVENIGGNNVTKVVVTDTATGGKFLSTSDSRCTGLNTDTLTCKVAKLAAGAKFIETHELQVATTGTSFLQDLEGRYSPNDNNRNSDAILAEDKVTILNTSADFDGRFANGNGDSVETDTALSEDNPYTTFATLNGSTFEVGLTVREQTPGPAEAENCPPSGCLGNEVIEFNITPLFDDLPDTYTLIITIAGEVVGNAKIGDLVVRHDGHVVGLCPDTDSDPAGACISDRSKAPSTKIATFTITGPGDGNGSWGVG
jgi:uncharacterized repeat protein (TIGR01451 family)